MKKKLFVLFMAFSLLFITGCQKKEEKIIPGSLMDLKFNCPSGYTRKDELEVGASEKTILFKFGDGSVKSANIYYNNFQGYYSYENEDTKYEKVTINGTEWRVIHNVDYVPNTDIYYVERGMALYRVEITYLEKDKKDFDSFIESLKFESEKK